MSAGAVAVGEHWATALVGGAGPLLRTTRAGRAVRCLEAVDSTMDEVARWMAAGAPDGALVVAATQTAGRGRMGRRWSDEAGASLLCSVLLRADVPPALAGLVPIAAGAACAGAVADAGAAVAELKWPNDVLLGGRKVAGILVEAQAGAFIVGVGINLTDAAVPDELRHRATSLAGRAAPATLLATMLNRLEPLVDGIAADAGAAVRDAWEARMHGRGEAVTVSFPGTTRGPVEGTALGLAADGALRIGTPDGELVVHSGDATLRAS